MSCFFIYLYNIINFNYCYYLYTYKDKNILANLVKEVNQYNN